MAAEKLGEEDLNTSEIWDWAVNCDAFGLHSHHNGPDIVVLAPFHIPILIPRQLVETVVDALSALRIIPPRKVQYQQDPAADGEDVDDDQNGKVKRKAFLRWNFPMNFVTAPLIADLFLLAILAIGREEVRGGTVVRWVRTIYPRLIPWLSSLRWPTLLFLSARLGLLGSWHLKDFKREARLGIGSSSTFTLFSSAWGASLATTLLSSPELPISFILEPGSTHNSRWPTSRLQFSSPPTRLTQSFEIKFIVYTANMIVPVIATAIVLFPFLLYIIFADPAPIPFSIEMHELSEEAKAMKPVNPNIPHARGLAEEEEGNANDDQVKLLSLEEIMNPFLDKGGAAFGAVIMIATLVTLLALNASTKNIILFFGAEELRLAVLGQKEQDSMDAYGTPLVLTQSPEPHSQDQSRHSGSGDGGGGGKSHSTSNTDDDITLAVAASKQVPTILTSETDDRPTLVSTPPREPSPSSVRIYQATINYRTAKGQPRARQSSSQQQQGTILSEGQIFSNRMSQELARQQDRGPATIVSLLAEAYRWTQDTFPTVTAVVAHLPYARVPFAFTMFILVQALVTKGWMPVFAYGWDHWVNKTGTIGAIGGMGFLSVILCNASSPSRWMVYSIAIGVNYGAFSTAFSASLAGMLWRDILARKHIRVRSLRVNLPIIAIPWRLAFLSSSGKCTLSETTLPTSLWNDYLLDVDNFVGPQKATHLLPGLTKWQNIMSHLRDYEQ
ncbi:arsenite efflux transporter [Blastomyces gilchristii SLH14081]|uniref:Arsenite efflux transporter n=1 Tax=Blastomyces gilchristii (strain SLH14081) TaxID=559298 RepID=A0A179UQF2_BLAGS|nr:arsenite efflux transporter [Blastomyces gilchristii SLH14081]OAT10023.1 arsenite efflux transporter [Blastomyces gilchristii SLH14081]